jgi:hypothetical protein
MPLANQQEVDDSQGHLDLAKSLFQECGDRRWEARSLWLDSFLKVAKGTAYSAKSRLQEATSIFLEIGDMRDAVRSLMFAADLFLDIQEDSEAIGAAEYGLEISRQIGWYRGQALCLGSAALAYSKKTKVYYFGIYTSHEKALFNITICAHFILLLFTFIVIE